MKLGERALDGRYELTELVGEGGMANVYRATDVLDNRMVAVKILKTEYSESEEFQRRFRNESKAIAMMSHPNIVKIYDMGFSDKMQYIVMEFIDGITLKDFIDSEHVLNWKDTVHFVIQILRALQHAHNRGIVHRDIKPQNIMLLTDGTIKVMDFGIAKFARRRAAPPPIKQSARCTTSVRSRHVAMSTDAKSDIYSVGVMFYEMLTGEKAFRYQQSGFHCGHAHAECAGASPQYQPQHPFRLGRDHHARHGEGCQQAVSVCHGHDSGY